MSFEIVIMWFTTLNHTSQFFSVVEWPIMHMVWDVPTMIGLCTLKVDVPNFNKLQQFDHLYLNGMWLRVDLRTNTKKICV